MQQGANEGQQILDDRPFGERLDFDRAESDLRFPEPRGEAGQVRSSPDQHRYFSVMRTAP